MVDMTQVHSWFQRLNRPLIVIEYIISFAVLVSTATIMLQMATDKPGTGPEGRGSPIVQLIKDYEVVAIIFVLMSIAAIVNIFLLMTYSRADSVLCARARINFLFSLGFFFIGVLTMITFSPKSLLWVNEMVFSMIAGVLYLNIKVNGQYASWR
jgi:hypothetical protein